MRGLVIESRDLGEDWRAVAAAELYKDDGPFLNPEQLRRFNVYGKATYDVGASSKVQMTFGARPANQEGTLTAEGFSIFDANAGLRWKNVEVAVDIQNLFNQRWREVQFASTSQLPYEPRPVTGIHYSSGWPFTAIGRATLYWR